MRWTVPAAEVFNRGNVSGYAEDFYESTRDLEIVAGDHYGDVGNG